MHKGITAQLKIEGKEVCYISNFSIEETKDIVEVTALGSETKTKIPTLYSWSASADGAADFTKEDVTEGDKTTKENKSGHIALRDAMVNGTKVEVEFILDDKTSLKGNAYIESMSLDISAEDKANISISLSGDGSLTSDFDKASNPVTPPAPETV